MKELKKRYFQKFNEYPDVKMLKGKLFMNSLKKSHLSEDDKHILLGCLLRLEKFDPFDIRRFIFKFKNKIYTEKFFDTYDLQYIET